MIRFIHAGSLWINQSSHRKTFCRRRTHTAETENTLPRIIVWRSVQRLSGYIGGNKGRCRTRACCRLRPPALCRPIGLTKEVSTAAWAPCHGGRPFASPRCGENLSVAHRHSRRAGGWWLPAQRLHGQLFRRHATRTQPTCCGALCRSSRLATSNVAFDPTREGNTTDMKMCHYT